MRKRVLVAVFVATLGLASAAGVAMAGWWVTGTTIAEGHAADARLEVSGGQVDGLYPGGSVPAVVNVRNANDFPVQFRGFWFQDVQVDGAHLGCPAEVLSVGEWGPYTTVLMPQQSYTFEVGVVMSPDAPQACLGATFQITWLAEGGVGNLPTP